LLRGLFSFSPFRLLYSGTPSFCNPRRARIHARFEKELAGGDTKNDDRARLVRQLLLTAAASRFTAASTTCFTTTATASTAAAAFFLLAACAAAERKRERDGQLLSHRPVKYYRDRVGCCITATATFFASHAFSP
jgi:hypothetical protein